MNSYYIFNEKICSVCSVSANNLGLNLSATVDAYHQSIKVKIYKVLFEMVMYKGQDQMYQPGDSHFAKYICRRRLKTLLRNALFQITFLQKFLFGLSLSKHWKNIYHTNIFRSMRDIPLQPKRQSLHNHQLALHKDGVLEDSRKLKSHSQKSATFTVTSVTTALTRHNHIKVCNKYLEN